ncbi:MULTISPECIES: CdaR family transcriptional regulator [unclassified Streptomyces]|uniref:PucR family transcriptional regulator n=1 Tax=unclassified Streptomyces TaxID=2593676 RepID=UPI00278BC3EE|nr:MULTISPECIES: helix-turn-helix domain-containing protein [unclassified Streptomyces]
MALQSAAPDEAGRLTEARVAALAAHMRERLPELTRRVQTVLAEKVTDLQGDPRLLDLLYGSTESNLETVIEVVRYGIPADDLTAPSAAEEYARRLARHGISSNALTRAYRLAHEYVLDWASSWIVAEEPDPVVAYAACREFTGMTFRYIDSVSEQVVRVYEAERERYLANRGTVRAAMITSLLAGEQVRTSAAEAALGYGLGQRHLGVVLWGADRRTSTQELRLAEALLAEVATAAGGKGQPLLGRNDGSGSWGWIPLGHGTRPLDLVRMEQIVASAGAGLRVAIGSPAAGVEGFRQTHVEALRARTVAMAAAERARMVTSFTEPGVRAAALLAADPDAARQLVRDALGALAADTEPAARLRGTLLAFVAEKGSYVATAERTHLHKNTVKYRVDRAIEERGRPLDGDWLDLELALIACEWLGADVLTTDAE